jgi:hypothetical protein
MSNRTTGVVAAGLGVLVAIGLVLLIMNLTGGDDGTAVTVATSVTTTTAAPTSTLPPATTVTTSPPTTVAPTTTAAATTTTAAPFTGDLSAKNCVSGFPNADRVTDIRIGEHDGFTRIVFDFAGDVPACFVTQVDPNTISVLVWGVSWTTPFADGIFDGSGILEVDLGSVDRVRDAGMGAGSGEWTFYIHTNSGDRPFSIFTLSGPARLVIDVGN